MKNGLFTGFVGAALMVAAVGCSGSDGAPGQTGPAGATGPAGPAGSAAAGSDSVSAVTPAHAFLARTVDVEISGFGTSWSASAAPIVDFGAGITVKNVTVASATGLVATIVVGKGAALGAHDVTVTAAGKSDVFKGAFKVEAPMSFSSQGTLAQGSIVIGHVTDKDVSTPFDTTQQGDGFLTPITYPNLNFTALAGGDVSVSGAAVFGVDFTMLVDVNAPTSAQSLELASGPKGQADVFPLPSAFTLAARTGTTLNLGANQGTAAKPFDSMLYTFTPVSASATIVEMAATSSVSGAAPALVLLPKSGKFADMLGFSASHSFGSTSADPYYAIYWDNTGTAGAFTITTRSTPATAAPFAANGTSKANAQTAAIPAVLTGGKLVSASDAHWVKITAAAADVGKVVHVVTYAGDPRTDTVVDVQDGTGKSLGGPSADKTFHEDFKSSAIAAAGDYYVIVSASAQGYDPAHQSFGTWIRLE